MLFTIDIDDDDDYDDNDDDDDDDYGDDYDDDGDDDIDDDWGNQRNRRRSRGKPTRTTPEKETFQVFNIWAVLCCVFNVCVVVGANEKVG